MLAPDQPTWRLVLEAAEHLNRSTGTFQLSDLVKEVQRRDPGRGKTSIHPIVQGMTSNAGKGPLSPCGQPLFRIQHGWYQLGGEVDEVSQRKNNEILAVPSTLTAFKSERRQQELEARIEGVIEEFSSCLATYEQQVPFTRNGQYSWHRATIDRRRSFTDVRDAIQDEVFVDNLYETLQVWGIGRRASRLISRAHFGVRLSHCSDEIASLDHLRLDDRTLNAAATGKAIWKLIEHLEIVNNISHIVPGTKTLHHLLPDLIPPMDRAWTGKFFLWSATAPQYEQEQTFTRTFSSFAKIATSTNPSLYVGSGWRTSATKLLDNAIIGYCKIHGLVPGSRETEEKGPSSIDVLADAMEMQVREQPAIQVLPTDQMPSQEIGRVGDPTLPAPLTMKHLEFADGQKGISYDSIFGLYLQGAHQITLIDPYIRFFTQMRNLMEFLETVSKFNSVGTTISVKLITIADPDSQKAAKQQVLLNQVKTSALDLDVHFSFEFDQSRVIHDRTVSTDTGWKFILGRGLDIFQFIQDDPFNIANKNQMMRKVKQFSVTYVSNR